MSKGLKSLNIEDEEEEDYQGIAPNISICNKLAKCHTFTPESLLHFCHCMVYFGTDQIAQFSNLSPLFKDFEPSQLSRMRYSVLGTTSVKGYDKKNLNVFKLALYHRSRYDLFQAMKLTERCNHGKILRPWYDKKDFAQIEKD